MSMGGYRDPNDNDDELEADRWDTVLRDFGVATYFQERYGFDIETLEEDEEA